MSDELRDEVEAINSIYGDNTLAAGAPGSGSYVLQLPGAAASLRLQFPAGYPDTGGPPRVLGMQHSAGARDVARLLTAALDDVYQPGGVCLFDAVEEVLRQRVDEEVEVVDDDAQDLAALPPPPWTLSEQVVDTRSTFVAHVARVTSPAQARLYVAQLLASDRRIRDATHNMTAWRVRGAGVSYQDCDDDGEDAAGGRLLHLMQLMELWDVMVVVTRWYGGVKLGPRRFAVINAVARDAFVRAGLVPESGGGKGRKK
ncbi:impact family protein [Cordyceps militaris CM01]|uniref:Impact family protein n=1 Tax=Cordyceps militaris (strain CM01) TaxID=983644 RepID=G3J9H7_CORMM|nr:impact family protein [Cordyceps militaris CM01]EGX94954.1 impact family protein [Cordyceps militaris CM01]